MGDCRRFQLHIYATYTALKVLELASARVICHRGTIWDIVQEIAGSATKNVTLSAICAMTGDSETTINRTALDAIKELPTVVEDMTENAFDTVMQSKGATWNTKCTEVMRASFTFIISNEEIIDSSIAESQEITTSDTVDRRMVIDIMLAPDLVQFEEMNLGGRCWYLARMWRLVAEMEECWKNFFDLVSRCNNPVIDRFVSRMTAPGYSRAQFLKLLREPLPPPLLAIVYDYLAAPSADSIREEILSLI